ncbi:MAG TPA: ISKra4 family transposase, partial [Coriobacteriia bacterium]|nr:ISKra4 family transposase [Coriobacteriia bacterium]
DGDDCHSAPPPAAKGKWLTASVVDDAATVVAQIFDEADRRDPTHVRTWIALVDGNNHQIDRIRAQAAAREIDVTIVIDFVHVIEYLWRAAWSFHDEGAPAAETWVRDQAHAVLAGRSKQVAAAIRRKATRDGLEAARRANADICATYLVNKAPYLDYPTALAAGWPIATGVIEGACRHLVKDRMDLTGARWSLHGAEAILKLRAIHSNDDFTNYWRYHIAQEHQRVHQSRYADGATPEAA